MTKRISAAADSIALFDSAVGQLRLVFAGEDLIGIYLPSQADTASFDHLPSAAIHVSAACRRWLTDYFDGAGDLANDWRADDPRVQRRVIGTEFQQMVWRHLMAIPFGDRRSYGEIARAVGRPSSVRAVGAAIGDNPMSILIPCHRVVGASGALTGYAGGLDAKRWLLDWEMRRRSLFSEPHVLAT